VIDVGDLGGAGDAGVAPLLVLVDGDSPHRFAAYVAEILQVEGYNWFALHDLGRQALRAEDLARHQIVVAAHVALSDEVQDQLLAYVRAGGNLIALRPPERLAAALGLAPANFGIADCYLSLNPLCALNAGAEPLRPAAAPAPVGPIGPRLAAPVAGTAPLSGTASALPEHGDQVPSLQFHGRGDLYWPPRNPSQVMAWFEGVKGIRL
jgi:hypothetical protein